MVAQNYDDIAEWYAGWVGDVRRDPLYTPLEEVIGDVAGLRVCDLACGEGRVARHLAERGARVVGVDISAKLLVIARERSAPAVPVEYVRPEHALT